MKTVRGPQYGSLSLLILVMVLPIALIFGLLSAFAGYSLSAPIGFSIAMFIGALFIHRRCVVDVGDEGIKVVMVAPRPLLIAWNDIEAVEAHPLSLRVVRRSTEKRPFVQMLCPKPLEHPVGRTIQAHIATSEPEQSSSV